MDHLEPEETHPGFRFYAERVIRKIVSGYAGHPAVIGYQVDNEPGILAEVGGTTRDLELGPGGRPSSRRMR